MKYGFIGPAYSGRAKNADAERSINLYLEKMESPEAKATMVLLGTPGLAEYCDLGGATVRGYWKEPATNRVFAVCDSTLWEITAGGLTANRGALTADPVGSTSWVSMRSNGLQLAIASEGAGYVLNLTSNVFVQITAAGFPGSSMFEFLDEYMITLDPNTARFYISNVNDATDWNALDFATKDGWPDDIIALAMDHRELWLFGSQRSEVWYDAGGVDFPFQRINGAVIEAGIIAKATVERADNSIFWLGGDERGAGVAYRSNGYQALRISNHAVEYQWSLYSTITDAETYTYQEGGHIFVVYYFPSGDPDPTNQLGLVRGATWAYDCSTGQWHERAWWDSAGGTGYHAHLGRNHVYGLDGRHMVGARNSGKIYTQSLELLDDAGDALRRLRSSPVFQELKWVYFKQLIVYCLTGQVQLYENDGITPRDPLCYLRISDDGGFTWGDYIESPMGQLGAYLFRVMWRSLGRSQDRVFEWTCSEAIPIALNEAFLEAAGGTGA